MGYVDMRDPADIVAELTAPKPRRMTVEVLRGKDGGWYARLRARNGRTVNVTESYTRRASAIRAARRLPAQIAAAEIKVLD